MTTERHVEMDSSELFEVPLNRRDFLKATGGGIILLFTIGELPAFGAEEGGRSPGRSLPTEFNAFLKIGPDGRVTCFTGKIEMGQGVITSLAQELADEMDVPLDAVDMVMGDTALCPWDAGTWGSLTTRVFGPALRQAGAEARQVLLELAAEKLKLPVEKLSTADAAVFHKDHEKTRVTYAQLATGKQMQRRATGKVAVKKPGEFRVIGQSIPRRDGAEKVSGKAKYAADLQLPDMLFARILRPPAHGAKLLEVDTSDAEKMKGVRVVRDGDLIAVLHKYPDVAEQALGKVKAKFDKPASTLDDKTIFEHLVKAAPEGHSTAQGGDLALGQKQAKVVVESTFFDGYKAHAPMEPHAAVAKFEKGKVTIWASTQSPFGAQAEVAKALSLSQDDVRVMPTLVGGGFGGKSRNPQVVEAARLAKLTGKPVQVAFTREEEFFYDSFRPAAVVTIKSGIGENGQLTAWDYHVYAAGDRGAAQFYNVPNHSTVSHGMMFGGRSGPELHPFATGPWRAPGNNTNTFARESQIDIMAAKAGIDPLQFRLQNLTDERMKRVLKAAAEKFGWEAAKSPSGKGRGIACGMDAGTWVATIAEVEVDKATGNITVKRMVCAQDMGLVINPDGSRMQVEGGLTMGLGYALHEDLRFKGGEILDSNFDTYELPRFSWLPKIETVLIDNPEAPPQGGGEPAIITVGGAIANAVFDAVGARVFQQPLTPERVRAAMKP